MTAHSKIGASSAYRWMACPGSVRLSVGVESTSSPYAMEGTLAHEIAADRLATGSWRHDSTLEMREHCQVYVDLVEREAVSTHPDEKVQIFTEHGFHLKQIHPDAFGTADRVHYYPKLKLLRVYDLKYGAGMPVEVFEDGKPNPQLMYYGLGALLSLPDCEIEEVELVICQPRCVHADGPIRRHSVLAAAMLDFAFDLEEFARCTEDPNAPLVPGDHCGFCPAAGFCPAIHEKALTTAVADFSQALPYDPEKLSKVLAWLPSFKQWISSVEAFAYQEANRGRTPPGFKLVDKVARRKWRPDVTESVVSLELGLDPSMIVETSLLSPAQVEKLLSKDQKAFLETLTVKESNGTTLVHESDKRPAVTTAAVLDFTPL